MRILTKGPDFGEILQTLSGDRAAAILVSEHSRPSVNGRYYHWDELRRRTPPDGLSSEEWWFGVKMARSQARRMLPFADTSGRLFSYVLTDEALSILHRIDQQAAGRIQMPEVVTNSATRDRYIVAGLIEEAISSSLLEGAATTRRDAKQLLRSGRSPRTIDERMVVNNYRTMQNLRRDLKMPLTVGMVLDIHRMVADGTLDRPEEVGRFQQTGEERVYGLLGN